MKSVDGHVNVDAAIDKEQQETDEDKIPASLVKRSKTADGGELLLLLLMKQQQQVTNVVLQIVPKMLPRRAAINDDEEDDVNTGRVAEEVDH